MAGIHYTTFAQICAPDLHSGEVDASCRNSVPVCRFELADFIKNDIVYEFRVTDPIFEHILFSFFMHLLFA